MNPLNSVSSPHQNNLDHQFDPLLEKPKAKSNWVAMSTPTNYMPKEDDLTGFRPLQVLKKTIRVVSRMVTSMCKGRNLNEQTSVPLKPLTPTPYAPARHLKSRRAPTTRMPVTSPAQLTGPTLPPAKPKPQVEVGVLVDLSIKPEHESPYLDRAQKPSTSKSTRKALRQEFNKMLSEMNNLEKQMRKQDWYQELMEVFPAMQNNNPRMAKNLKRKQKRKLRNQCKSRECTRLEQGQQKLDNLLKDSQNQARKNLSKIQQIRQGINLKEHESTRKTV